MLNNINIMGRLTKNPELKQTPNGISVVTFSLAVARDYDKEKTDFFNVVAWRQTAEFISNHFTKGQLIVIKGNLQNRQYEDKDKQKRTITEIIAEQVYFADSQKNNTKSLDGLTPPPEKISSPNTFSENTNNQPIINEYDYYEVSTNDDELPY